MMGKLSKMAKGNMQTHAAGSEVDMEFLASLAAELRGSAVLLEDIRAANTAHHVLDLCREAGLIGITTLVYRKVAERCTRHPGGGLEVLARLVDFGGGLLGRYRKRFHERHAGGILSTMMSGLETGFILDRQWFRLQGEMERTKRPPSWPSSPYACVSSAAPTYCTTSSAPPPILPGGRCTRSWTATVGWGARRLWIVFDRLPG